MNTVLFMRCATLLLGFIIWTQALIACEFEHIQLEEVHPIELLGEREQLLKDIGQGVAKFLEVPFIPSDMPVNEYLNITIGSLGKIILAERKWSIAENEKQNDKVKNLIELVEELKKIKQEINLEQLQKLIFSQVDPEQFIQLLQWHIADQEQTIKEKLTRLINRIAENNCQSKTLRIPKYAGHACLVIGMSCIKYKTRTNSPLFFSYSFSQIGRAPKFGVSLGAGANAFTLNDSMVRAYGHNIMALHPDHPCYLKPKTSAVTFNWEGSFCFIQGAIDQNSQFGTAGIGLPLGFSIGPQFIEPAAKITITHDTWQFLGLIDVEKAIGKL